MTITEFLKVYKFSFETHNLEGITYVAITKVIRRNDNLTVDRVRTSIDIFETNNWIVESQQPHSIFDWDWNKVIEQTKRNQLDYFAQRIPITDFYPLNSETDIASLYI